MSFHTRWRLGWLWTTASFVAFSDARASTTPARVAEKPAASYLAFHETVELDHPFIQKRISFWKKVFSWYTRSHAIIHHKDYPWIVYKVIRLPVPVSSASRSVMFSRKWEAKLESEIQKSRDLLNRIATKRQSGQTLDASERNLFRKFKGLPKSAIQDAIKPGKFRVQRGMREDFQIALKRSKKYIPGMEKVFQRYDVPVQLTRLPFIESMFDRNARSSVGALGLWQFMPETARMYGLEVHHPYADERKHPLASTKAAAKFLRDYFRIFKSWPLAITAYNHGVRGIQTAVRTLSTTEIQTLIHRWDGRAFGFAAQNFYCEFMAVLELESFPEQWLGSEDLSEVESQG